MKVKVYFNLHRKMWSVLSMTPKGWRLAFHERELTLQDVTFKVSEAGRQRVIREKRKNVHAFAIGTLIEPLQSGFEATLVPVSYNPYKAGTFMCEGKAVTKCEYATFGENRQVLGCLYPEKEVE